MLRKLGLVVVAAASLGALHWRRHRLPPGMAAAGTAVVGIAAGADLASSSAAPAYVGGYGYGGCYVRRLVPTPWGPRWRLINRCY